MTQVVRTPDLGRQIDSMQDRIAALERRVAASLGPAGGDLRGTYPNPTLKPREGAGRIGGTAGFWSGNITNADTPFVFYDGNVGNTPFRLGPFTPSVNCWWPVSGMILVRILDALWLVMNIDLRLNVVDATGFNTMTCTVEHNSAAGAHVTATPNAVWALTAGVAYTCTMLAGYMSGGTWNWYYGGSQHTYIFSPGAFPR